jgi:dTDP-4-amino-4,6-dideoxygalactose transaminase
MQTAKCQIPYVNISAQHAAIKGELMEAVSKVIDDGTFVLGPQVEQFEQEFAKLCGVRHAIGLNSGTDALILALRALGIGHGDEVITAPNSFVASASAIALVGAKPVFVDVREDYNLDPTLIEAAITPRTRAIIPVHLTGRPCDMDPIGAIASAHGLKIVEDCAQAVLAEFKGKRVGSFGAVGCFSLHPLKTLNACGDGGMLTTNDDGLAEQFKLLRNIGMKTREDCRVWSGNSRLDTLQAAILLVKLRHLQRWTERRRENARFYQKALAGLKHVQTPSDRADEFAVYHTFVIQSDRRDALRAHLTQNGIGSAIHYPTPIHLTAAARELGHKPGDFPVTEKLAARILSLPVYPELSIADLGRVASSIRAFDVSETAAAAA